MLETGRSDQKYSHLGEHSENGVFRLKYTISGKLAKNNVLELEISHLGLNIQKLGFHVKNRAKIWKMGS